MRRALLLASLGAGVLMASSPSGPSLAVTDDYLPGVLLPSDVVDLAPAVDGQITAVHVDVGDRVTTNQVVAELDDRVEAAAVDLARVRAESDVAVRTAMIELEEARRRHAQRRGLREQGILSAEEFAEVEAEVELAGLTLLDAQQRAREAQLELAQAEATLAQRDLVSPIDGVVVRRELSPGELAARSGQSVVLQLAQVHPLRVEVHVPAALLDQVTVGASAEVAVDQPGRPIRRATVEAVQPVVDAGSESFPARLRLDNEDGALPAGVRCGVRFDD